jgi:hypothetical protein
MIRDRSVSFQWNIEYSSCHIFNDPREDCVFMIGYQYAEHQNHKTLSRLYCTYIPFDTTVNQFKGSYQSCPTYFKDEYLWYNLKDASLLNRYSSFATLMSEYHVQKSHNDCGDFWQRYRCSELTDSSDCVFYFESVC